MKLDRRILSHLLIGVGIDLFYYRIAVFIIVTFFFMKHNLCIWNLNKMLFFF